MSMARLSAIGEKGLIASMIRPLFGDAAVDVGVGDDAAVVSLQNGPSLVLTIDKIPEQLVAVSLGLMDDYDVGRYLVVANLSDLAAMGADPVAFLMSLCLPADLPQERLASLLRGIGDAASDYDTPVVGGDTGGGSAISLVGVAVGTVSGNAPLTRCGARPGDVLLATGSPGTFGVALAYFMVARPAGLRLPTHEEDLLRDKLAKPVPRLKDGRLLRQLGLVTACQDISDGVGQTARELSQESGVGVLVESRSLIASSQVDVSAVARACNVQAAEIMLGPGADFELLVAIPSERAAEATEALHRSGQVLSCIGHFTDSGCSVAMADGSRLPIPETGWSHFSGLPDLERIRKVYSRGTRDG